jgi:transposase InsO family protein
VLFSETIEAAYQLSAFVASKHPHADEFGSRALALIEFVVNSYQRQEQPVEEPTRQTLRSLLPIRDFPSDWAIHKPTLRKALKHFLATCEDRFASTNAVWAAVDQLQATYTGPEPLQLLADTRSVSPSREASVEVEVEELPAPAGAPVATRQSLLRPPERLLPAGQPRAEAIQHQKRTMARLANDPLDEPSNTTRYRSADDHTNFSEAQTAYIKSQIDAAVAQALSGLRQNTAQPPLSQQPRARFAENPAYQSSTPARPGPRTSPTQEIPRSDNDFGWDPTPINQPLPGNHKLDELGYFYPNLPEPSDAAVVTIGKEVYYRDVNKFITRVRDVAAARGEAVLQQHLFGNLRGAAMDWYTDQIDEKVKLTLRFFPLEQGWIEKLSDRFKPAFDEAIDKLNQMRITVSDIKNGADVSSFASEVIRRARAAEYTTVYQQLNQVWIRLDADMQLVIPRPTTETTLQQFFTQLDEKRSIWRRRAYQSTAPGYSFRFNQEPRPQPRYAQTPYYSNMESLFNPSTADRPNTFPNRSNRQPYDQSIRQPYNPAPAYNQPQGQYNQGSSNYRSRPQGNQYGYQSGNQQFGNRRQIQAPYLAPAAQPKQLPWHGSDPQKQLADRPSYRDNRDGRPNQANHASAYTADPQDSTSTPAAEVAYDSNPVAEEQRMEDSNDFDSQQDADPQTGDFNYEYPDQPIAHNYEAHVNAVADIVEKPSHRCFLCKQTFNSNNKLHDHIRGKCQPVAAIAYNAQVGNGDLLTVESTGIQLAPPGHAFKGWHYCTVRVLALNSDMADEACFDTGCSITLVDEDFLSRISPDAEIQYRSKPVDVKGIGDDTHQTAKFTQIAVRMKATLKGKEAILTLHFELHIVRGLRANILFGTDMMARHQIAIDVGRHRAVIGSCHDAIVDLRITAKPNHQVCRPVYSKDRVVIPAKSNVRLPIKMSTKNALQADREYVFTPQFDRLSVYAHAVDHNFSFVHAANFSSRPVVVQPGARMGFLSGFDEVSAYLAGPEAAELARTEQRQAPRARLEGNTTSGTKLANGVTVHGDENTVRKLARVVNKFDIWTDHGGFADVPENEWMRIPLAEGWESQIAGMKLGRVYPMSPKDQEVINNTFDKLHDQGRMDWTDNHSPSGYPVFVVWRRVEKNGQWIMKSRVVVDIRHLNKMTTPDIYPMPLQSEILAMIAGKRFISVIDAVAFFHQWRVWGPHRNRLTVVSHRGQEVLNCVPMGFINSVAYVQRQLDNKLRAHRLYCRSYVDDILVASETLEEHEKHLHDVFADLERLHICLAPEKAYIGFPSITLLGQRVDALGISTPEERLRALTNLDFPETLSQLETYLGMAGYFRSYISRYAQIADPLEDRKRTLMRPGPTAGKARKNFAKAAQVAAPTKDELTAFQTLQLIFAKALLLVHHNRERIMFVDLDAAKGEGGFGGMVYHVDGELSYIKPGDKITPPPRQKVQPILFLSRTLNVHEKRYWPTELEVACLVWILKKIRHLVEASKQPVIVWTDHAATIPIAKQTSLTTSSTDKLNLRLVQAAAYIQRFQLQIYHKPGKDNIVPDALSRLPSKNPQTESEPILDTLFTEPSYAFHILMIEVADDFKTAIATGYDTDRHWKPIIDAVRTNEKKGEGDRTELPYEIDDNLLYSTNHVGERRLVIPDNMVKEVFKQAHDESNHAAFKRAFEKLHGLTMRRMRHQLEAYIRGCPQCATHQTRRHKPYGDLQPILSPPIPFHTVSIDFILALPETEAGYNAAVTMTDKFTKAVEIVPGKDTWTAAEWGTAMAQRLLLIGWGIPLVWLSDRDSKFLSQMWTSIFSALGVRMLYSTAYHSQTDGASERTNQTVEIALRYYIEAMDDPRKWVEVIPTLQAAHASTVSTATGFTPNMLKFGIETVRALDGISPHIQRTQDFSVRIEAAEAIATAQMAMKRFYDAHYLPKSFAVGDQVYLQLHKGYSIPTVVNKKLSPQYAGPFEILERVGRLAYRLKLPQHWTVHPVISIAHLEPFHKDAFNRPHPDHPDTIFTDGDDDNHQSFEVDRLIDKRIVTRRGKKEVDYLVRWKGYSPAYDLWYHESLLENCKELIDDYESLHRPVRQIQPHRGGGKRAAAQAINQPIDTVPPTTDANITAPTVRTDQHDVEPTPPRRSNRLMAKLTNRLRRSKD